MNEQNNKNLLRQSSRDLRNSFGEEFIEKNSFLVGEKLSKLDVFVNADTVLMYYPIKNELSPLPLFDLAQKMGKAVAFPLCNTENNTLIFKEVSDLSELNKSSFGLLEPNKSCKDASISQNTLCITPALLFSREGYRLGYGKGFYDKFLAEFIGISVGISFSSLVCDSLPKEDHDKKLDILITENEVIYFDKEN